MPNHLCVSVTFLDPIPAFHGRCDADEPEWPPSPLRLFQSLLGAAASRWRNGRFKAQAHPALEWLEQQPAPIILAPINHPSVSIRIAVPNNDMNVIATDWAKRQESKKQPSELKTLKTVRPTWLITGENETPTVRYLWPLAEDLTQFEKYKEVLFAAARSIAHLGWGIDMVAANATVISWADAGQLAGERWNPNDGSPKIGLRIPLKGTLNALIDRHDAFLKRLGPDGFTPVPPLTTFRVVGYRRASDLTSRPSVVFELRNDDWSRFSYPQEKLIHISGMLRHLAIGMMQASPPERIDSPSDWVRSYVAGHRDENSEEHQQFSYLPLPSIGQAHTNPSIRRVMIAAPLDGRRFLDHLAMYLAGQRLKPTSLTRLDNPPTLVRIRGNSVTARYTDPASTWTSVTPVILPGHDDHKPEKTRKLIETALRQSGIDQPCEFEWGAFSKFPKSLSAHKYDRQKRPSGYIRPDHLLSQTAVHLTLRFKDVKIPGPMSIGSGRHCGLGLMAGYSSGMNC